MTDSPLYHIRNLTRAYGDGDPVLVIDRLDMPAGAIIGLAGPNGSGKSTLLKLMAFVERPTSGRLLYRGRPAAPFSESVRFRVSLLTQEPYLLKRSVYDNVAYGLKIRDGASAKNQRRRVESALRRVGLPPADFAHRSWRALSGGEAQRVALAARLALEPEALLLDEPTAGVDAASAQMIREAALDCRRRSGTTLVIVSHDRQWLSEVCDRVIHLYDGRIIGSGTENILFGPWTLDEEGAWEKRLPDGQRMPAPAPPWQTPPSGAALTIDPDAFSVHPDTVHPESALKPGPHRLTATLTRLALESASGSLIATLRAADIHLSARLTAEQVARDGLYPGRRVAVTYDMNRLQWR